MFNEKRIDTLKLTGALLLGGYLFFALQSRDFSHFIDMINLIFHEAGHFIFIFFGDFLHYLGGTLLEILIPLLFAAYFFIHEDRYSASIMFAWMGYNLTTISVYIADAILMRLPLLGCGTDCDYTYHDWNHLLTKLDLLPYTNSIANLVYGVGMAIFILGILASIWYSTSIRTK